MINKPFFPKNLGVGLVALALSITAYAQSTFTPFSSPPTQYVVSSGATDSATGLSGIFGENNVLFGGVEPPNGGGQAATSARSNAVYTLCDGCSINIAGKFYNRFPSPNGYIEATTNELYLYLAPVGSVSPLAGDPLSQGILIGGPVTSAGNHIALGLNFGDATQPRADVVSIPAGMPVAPNQWNVFSAKLRRVDTAGVPHLIVEQAQMNGTTLAAFTNKDLFHAPHGNAQFSWLSSGFNFGIAVDDYAAWMTAVLDAPAVTKAFSPAAVDLGGSSTLTLTVSNPMLLPAGSVAFTDTLPAPLQIGAGSVLSNTCGGTVTATTGTSTITLTGGSVPAATGSGNAVVPGTCTVSIDVLWPAAAVAQCNATPITNTIPAADFSTDLGQGSTAATANLQCPGRPIFNLVKTVSDAGLDNLADPGELLTYSLQVINTGNLAGVVTINDALPANTSFISASNGGTLSGSNVTWSGISVPAATTAGPGQITLTMTVQVANPLPQNLSSIANQALLNYPGDPVLPSCPNSTAVQPCGSTTIPVRAPALPVPALGGAGLLALAAFVPLIARRRKAT